MDAFERISNREEQSIWENKIKSNQKIGKLIINKFRIFLVN